MSKNTHNEDQNALTRGELTEVLQGFITHVDKRFDQVDKRFEQVDARFDELENKITGIDGKIDVLGSRVTGLSGRVERLEDDMRLVKTKLAI